MIPAPSAVTSLGEAVLASSIFLSSTVRVVEFIDVNDPSTVRFPDTVRFPPTDAFPVVVTLAKVTPTAIYIVAYGSVQGLGPSV